METGGVEEVQTIKGGLEGLVIGEVLTCEEHPNSDHLHITTVNVGGAEPLQIVCGAPNVAAGQKVVVAVNGTKLYDGDECFTIKRSKIRGVESNGMICAEDEIGIGTDHAGIIVLPADAVVGTPAKEYYNVKSDYVLEVDITPNRVDATSHFGVARDLAAYLKQNGKPANLKRPSVDAFKIDDEVPAIEVVVENKEACLRYSGITIKNVTVKESPEWLQNRLKVIGLRPINNVVDITNYILHGVGQPLHSFDADKIKGNKVVVRSATEGAKFVTLDGVERTLTDRDLMICNVEEPMCIAGVFGGLDSGVIGILIHRLGRDCVYFSWSVDPNEIPYADHDERLIIKDICKQEHIQCHYSQMKSDRSMNSLLARQMQSLGFSLDENEPPALRYAMPPYINAMALCDSCSCMHENGASVIFTGHGGDEGISHRSSPYEMFYHHEYYHFFRSMWSSTLSLIHI